MLLPQVSDRGAIRLCTLLSTPEVLRLSHPSALLNAVRPSACRLFFFHFHPLLCLRAIPLASGYIITSLNDDRGYARFPACTLMKSKNISTCLFLWRNDWHDAGVYVPDYPHVSRITIRLQSCAVSFDPSPKLTILPWMTVLLLLHPLPPSFV